LTLCRTSTLVIALLHTTPSLPALMNASFFPSALVQIASSSMTSSTFSLFPAPKTSNPYLHQRQRPSTSLSKISRSRYQTPSLQETLSTSPKLSTKRKQSSHLLKQSQKRPLVRRLLSLRVAVVERVQPLDLALLQRLPMDTQTSSSRRPARRISKHYSTSYSKDWTLWVTRST